MNQSISTNFLLLKDYEQRQIIFHLSKDFSRKHLFKHFATLYNLKLQYIKSKKNTVVHPPKPIKEIKEELKNLKPQRQILKIEPSVQTKTYFKKFLVNDKLQSLIKDKNVALIGPAKYLLNMEQGPKIDQYDITIRFNSSILTENKFEKYVGKETDIWIYNFKDLTLLDKLTSLPKMIFCPYPKSLIDKYQIDKKFPECPIEFIENDFYYQLQQAMNFEPNSALLTILILLRQNIKSLYVSGLSFMYDGYYDAENNKEKNTKITSGALVVSAPERNNFISILKKVYNVNEKLFLDNTIINLIYPNFIEVLNKLFHKDNHKKLFSSLNYTLFVPSFQSKYNSPSNNSKIFINFGKGLPDKSIVDKMHLIIHSIKPKLYSNEIFVKYDKCDYDDLDYLLKIKNKGIVHFSNNQWNAINSMIPDKNRNYILSHHCYVNGNIYGSFIKYIAKDFDISDNELYMVYMMFSMIYYGQKMVYVNKRNIYENGLEELINVMKKLNLVKYIS